MKMQIPRIIVIVRILNSYCYATPVQDQSGNERQTPQQRAEELKQSIAANRAKLTEYKWVETTVVTGKGEVKKQEQQQCYYGADGNVQTTPIGSPSTSNPKAPPRGIRGKVVEKNSSGGQR